VTAAEVLERREPKKWDKLSRAQLELARQAADDLVRRSPKKDAFARFAPKDKRIRVLNKKQTEAILPRDDRPELVRAYAPGYAPDKRLAILRLAFTMGVHGGIGTYVLERKDGRWVVLLHDFNYFL
jgi:hypothetical protein